MIIYKMSILCNNLPEFMEIAELLLSRKKGLENVADNPNSDDSPPDNRSSGQTGQGDQGESSREAPAESPKRRGRPKGAAPAKKEAVVSELPGVITLESLKVQARKFAQLWGAPSLMEALGSFGAKSTNDLKPESYQQFSDLLSNFNMQTDDSSEPETTEDPYNDLLG